MTWFSWVYVGVYFFGIDGWCFLYIVVVSCIVLFWSLVFWADEIFAYWALSSGENWNYLHGFDLIGLLHYVWFEVVIFSEASFNKCYCIGYGWFSVIKIFLSSPLFCSQVCEVLRLCCLLKLIWNFNNFDLFLLWFYVEVYFLGIDG